MTFPFKVSINPKLGIKFTEKRMILEFPGTAVVSVKAPTPSVHDLIKKIHNERASLDDLIRNLMARGRMDSLREFQLFLNLFDRRGWICRWVTDKTQNPISLLIPYSEKFKWAEKKIDQDQMIMISKFTHIRSIDGQMHLETPLGNGKIILFHSTCLLVLHELSTPVTIKLLTKRVPSLPLEEIKGFLSQLFSIRAILGLESGENPSAKEGPHLEQWEFHDLLFHTRSRKKRLDKPFGTTFPFLDKQAPLPALKKGSADKRLDLPVPDLDSLQTQGPPLGALMENPLPRGVPPQSQLTLDSLGQFLYRTARVREEKEITLKKGRSFFITDRPYPAMGSVYELEIYPVIKDCPQIETGLYHYDPKNHGLEPVCLSGQEIEPLLDEIDPRAELRYERMTAFVITARFQRMGWLNRSISYSAILCDLGILLQTMNLVARSMGLLPDIIHGKPSGLFSELSGIDEQIEPCIGEFTLGGNR